MRAHHPGKTPGVDQPGRTVKPAAGPHAAISRSAVGDVPGGRGHPLAAPVTEGNGGARLGGDFSHVPVYSGSAARAAAAEAGALACTSGSHVVIGDGGADTHGVAHMRTARRGGSELMAEGAAFKPAPESSDYIAVALRVNEPPASAEAGRSRPVGGLLRPSQVAVPGETTSRTGSPFPAGGRALPGLQRLRPTGALAGAALPLAGPSTVQARPVQDVLRSSGQPLADPLREEMQARLGADFSDVRVHTDDAARASAAGVGARAYTSGSHIVIGDGGADKRTLAHELTHVLQQRTGPVAGTDHGGVKVSDPSDVHERAAEATARRVMSSTRRPDQHPGLPPGGGPAVARSAPAASAIQRVNGDDEGEWQTVETKPKQAPKQVLGEGEDFRWGAKATTDKHKQQAWNAYRAMTDLTIGNGTQSFGRITERVNGTGGKNYAAHVSIETRAVKQELRSLVQRGSTPGNGWLLNVDFHVTVEVNDDNKPNPRTWSNNRQMTGDTTKVPAATSDDLLKMGRDWLANHK